MTHQPSQGIDRDTQFNHSFREILHKLRLLLDQESIYLQEGGHDELQEFARKKTSLFSQLRLLNSRFSGSQLSDFNVQDAKVLQSGLVQNMKLLDTRIKAIQELNTTIKQAVMDERSDGTYSIDSMQGEGYV